MPRSVLRTSLASSLWRNSDPERKQAIARAVFVAGALAYAYSGYYATHAPSAWALQLGRWTALAAAASTALMLLSVSLRPGASRIRRIIGICHDITVITVTMYVGEEATAFFVVVYVVIILASGVRFGVSYLAFAALGSVAGFASMYALSPWWQTQFALSLNVVLILTVVPAYMFRLIYDRQRSRAELERRATHDSLTGLMNRAGFEQILEDFVAPGSPDQVLIYFDLDRFKAVNDSAGHAAGDRLLTEVADILRNCVRTGDVCARIGGDEFSVFLRQCSPRLGQEIAGRIKDRIHAHQMTWNDEPYSVDASIGVVPARAAEDGPSFLRLADAACYAAKNAGRNHIYVIDTARMSVNTDQIRGMGRQK